MDNKEISLNVSVGLVDRDGDIPIIVDTQGFNDGSVTNWLDRDQAIKLANFIFSQLGDGHIEKVDCGSDGIAFRCLPCGSVLKRVKS